MKEEGRKTTAGIQIKYCIQANKRGAAQTEAKV